MKNSPRYKHLHEIDATAPSKHFSKLIEKLPRRHSSLLFQLRSGHAPLNKHLHRIAKVPSPICLQCGEREETVHHFIITCPKYTTQCHALQFELGTQTNHLKNLLNNSKCIKPLLRFIASMHRMEQTFGDVTPPADEDDEEE